MKNNRKWLILGAIVLTILILFTIWLIPKNRNEELSYRMIYIPKIEDSTNDFWTSLLQGARMAAQDYNVELTVYSPNSEYDIEGQKKLIERAIEEHPDVLLLSPSSYTEVTGTVKAAKEAGLRVVLVDSFLDESIEDAAIATDNFRAGSKMGEYMIEKMDQDTVIGIVSHVQGSSTALQREEGLRASLGAYEKQIVKTVYCDSEYDKAYKLTHEMLTEHPDINVIFGLNEYSAVGAARAVRDLELEDTIKMVGFDSSIEEIQLLEADVFSGIVIQKPFTMGYLGVEKSVQLLLGERIEAVTDSGAELITKENMYTEENQKLLFPFWDR